MSGFGAVGFRSEFRDLGLRVSLGLGLWTV